MKYNPTIHHRRTIRLKGYDYAQAGLYFVTICVQNKQCVFGEIVNNEMILNDAGKMIEKWYAELPNKFSDIALGEFVVMPNHFHAIIINTGDVRPNLCVRPDDFGQIHRLGQTHRSAPTDNDNNILGEHIGSPLHRVVQWFKTMTTNEYIRGVKTLNWQPFDKKLWQRNYWEHIIRNEQLHQRIADYIVSNTSNWEKDKFFI